MSFNPFDAFRSAAPPTPSAPPATESELAVSDIANVLARMNAVVERATRDLEAGEGRLGEQRAELAKLVAQTQAAYKDAHDSFMKTVKDLHGARGSTVGTAAASSEPSLLGSVYMPMGATVHTNSGALVRTYLKPAGILGYQLAGVTVPVERVLSTLQKLAITRAYFNALNPKYCKDCDGDSDAWYMRYLPPTFSLTQPVVAAVPTIAADGSVRTNVVLAPSGSVVVSSTPSAAAVLRYMSAVAVDDDCSDDDDYDTDGGSSVGSRSSRSSRGSARKSGGSARKSGGGSKRKSGGGSKRKH